VPRFKATRNATAARFPQRSRKRSSDAAPGVATPDENLLYLMSELERALKHPKVTWSADLVTELQRRVIQIVIEIVARNP
jgi:hypothetical protein